MCTWEQTLTGLGEGGRKNVSELLWKGELARVGVKRGTSEWLGACRGETGHYCVVRSVQDR